MRRLLIIALVTLFLSATVLTRWTFDFAAYPNTLADDTLFNTALQRAKDYVIVEEITETVTRLVPLGEWMYRYGAIPNASEANPGQPVFVLAMKGTFRWGAAEDIGILPTTETFTIAIDAQTGRTITTTGMFNDPRPLVELAITFPPVQTVERTQEASP